MTKHQQEGQQASRQDKQRAIVRAQLVKFYELRNPNKLKQIDAIVKKYEDEGQLAAIPVMLSKAMTEEKKVAVRKQLVAFYTTRNPAKVKQIDAIIKQYEGRLDEIPIMMAKAEEAEKKAAQAKQRVVVREQLVKFYQVRNPDKLKQVDAIMKKYEAEGRLGAIPLMMAHAMAEEKKLAVRKQLVEFYEQLNPVL